MGDLPHNKNKVTWAKTLWRGVCVIVLTDEIII